MKNKLTDLNDHLFAQLERLSDEDLDQDAIDKEIKRTDAIVSISTKIIDNAKVSLDAAKLLATHGGTNWEQALPGVNGKPAAKKLPDFSNENVRS
jgi:hypothetical protein